MSALNCIVVCLQGRVLLYKALSAAAVHRVKPASKETLLLWLAVFVVFFPISFFLFVFFPEERRQGEEAKRARGRPCLGRLPRWSIFPTAVFIEFLQGEGCPEQGVEEEQGEEKAFFFSTSRGSKV